MSTKSLIEKIDACGQALTNLRNRAIHDPRWTFASRQYAELLVALHDLTEIDVLFDAAQDAKREAGMWEEAA